MHLILVDHAILLLFELLLSVPLFLLVLLKDLQKLLSFDLILLLLGNCRFLRLVCIISLHSLTAKRVQNILIPDQVSQSIFGIGIDGD